jgi:hypothetical protein
LKSEGQTLAYRLGQTEHLSLLHRKLQRLWRATPGNIEFLEEWLIELANARGARIIVREAPAPSFSAPSLDQLTNEELAIGLLLLQNRDSLQIVRLAAQLISRGELNSKALVRLAERERVGSVLAALSREALKVDPDHVLWNCVRDIFENKYRPISSILHYTRLAEPLMQGGRYNVAKWQLVR